MKKRKRCGTNAVRQRGEKGRSVRMADRYLQRLALSRRQKEGRENAIFREGGPNRSDSRERGEGYRSIYAGHTSRALTHDQGDLWGTLVRRGGRHIAVGPLDNRRSTGGKGGDSRGTNLALVNKGDELTRVDRQKI